MSDPRLFAAMPAQPLSVDPMPVAALPIDVASVGALPTGAMSVGHLPVDVMSAGALSIDVTSVGAMLVVPVLLACAVLVLPGPAQRDAELVTGGTGLAADGERAAGRSGESGGAAADRVPPDAESVAGALVLLALAYRSGLATWQVLESTADAIDGRSTGVSPAAADLRQVAAALRWGASDVEAWASVGPRWAGAAHAVVIAHAAGIAPGPVLLTAADDLNRAAVERLELAAAKVGVRLVAPLGLVLLPAFCLTTVVPLVIALARTMLTG